MCRDIIWCCAGKYKRNSGRETDRGVTLAETPSELVATNKRHSRTNRNHSLLLPFYNFNVHILPLRCIFKLAILKTWSFQWPPRRDLCGFSTRMVRGDMKATWNFKCNYFRLEYLDWKIWRVLFLIRRSHLTRAVTTQGLSVVNRKMKGHQKELTSAFKQFENVREVTEDLFLSTAYLPDELWGNNGLSLFHASWSKKSQEWNYRLMTTDKETPWLA